MTRITGTSNEDRFTLVISPWILLKVRNNLDKFVEQIKTQFTCSKHLFQDSLPLWDNVEKYGSTREATDYNIIRRMHFTCLIIKDTDTHSEYEIHYYFFTATLVTTMGLDVISYLGADKSLARPGKKQALKNVKDARDFNNIETRAIIKFFFPARQGAEGNSRHSDRNISVLTSWSG